VSRDAQQDSAAAVPGGALDAVEVLLCDADGNLFPSEEPAFVASTRVTNALMAQYGSDRRFTPEELRLATTGLNFRSTAVVLCLDNGIGVAPDLVPADRRGTEVAHEERPTLTVEALEEWVEREKQAVIDHLRSELRPDPEVLEPLHRLARRYGVAAVSSSADARIAACFEVTGLAGFFPPERRFSAEDSLPRPTSKPDPAIYRYAGERLGIGVHQGLAVEDSLPGASSAVAAGFATVGNLQFVPPDERKAREKALREIGVVAVVKSWAQVEALLSSRPQQPCPLVDS
jgi:beta-phosphoglucomutase-like phosphatase (HAD superfamily)